MTRWKPRRTWMKPRQMRRGGPRQASLHLRGPRQSAAQGSISYYFQVEEDEQAKGAGGKEHRHLSSARVPQGAVTAAAVAHPDHRPVRPARAPAGPARAPAGPRETTLAEAAAGRIDLRLAGPHARLHDSVGAATAAACRSASVGFAALRRIIAW